jgi:hypothetical protein
VSQVVLLDAGPLDDYLLSFNESFGAALKASDLKGTDPIISRIRRHLERRKFDHGRPADLMFRHRDEILPKLTRDTLDRFEKLFVTMNATLVGVAWIAIGSISEASSLLGR